MSMLPKTQPRGSIMFVGLLVVTILAMLTLGFTQNIIVNQSRTEADIAGSRAFHLAQAYSNVKAQLLWAKYQTIPTFNRINWVLANAIHPPYADNYDTSTSPPTGYTAFQPYGEGKAFCYVTVVNKGDSVDVTFRTIAVVESYGEGSAGVDAVKELQAGNPNNGQYVSFSGIRTVAREVELVANFGLGPAQIFDYVYFANNYGWMYGSTLNLYGNMGANGNLGFSGPPKVDGALFAARNPAIGAPGVINGTANFDSLTQYRSIAYGADNNPNTTDDKKFMPPTNPAAPGIPFGAGYDGTQPRQTGQSPLNMPYLSDLAMYQSMAQTQTLPARPDLGEPTQRTGGIVKQLKAPGLDATDPNNYNIIVNQTYGFNGENGAFATPTYNPTNGAITGVTMTPITTSLDTAIPTNNGNLALVGTAEQPIVVLGPVVISHDLVISGTMTGQGTFYTGRNVNVIGDTKYNNAPQWNQNDFDVNGTATANQKKDGVGFGAKGNVVFGDYTRATLSGGDGGDYWDGALAYIKPGFTAPYQVEAGDTNNGYVTSTSNGVPTFNGDYTANDGGKKFTTTANTTATTRRYYESSFSTSYIHSLATHEGNGSFDGKPSTVTGIFYCNHYLGGRLNNPAIYGTVIMRDEAMLVDGGANLYYDPRISKGALNSYINLYLPRNPQFNNVVYHELRDPNDGSPILDVKHPNKGLFSAGAAPVVFPAAPTRLTNESSF
jgi:hypothetical protein